MSPEKLEECKDGKHVMSDTAHCQCGFYPRPVYKLYRAEDSACDGCE